MPPNSTVAVFTPFSDDDFHVITRLVFLNPTSKRQQEVEAFLLAVGADSWALLSGIDVAELVTAEFLPTASDLSKPIFKQRLVKVLSYASVPNAKLSSTATFEELTLEKEKGRTVENSRMSDQSESERPRKRPRIVQTALGFDAEREEDHILLSNVLAFVATSEDLARSRRVCRAFRKCSDEIASAQTTALIGGSIKPMIGQAIVGLLHAAEEADEFTRHALKEWDPDIRKEGFDLGLPTKKEENQRWHIVAKVPCDPLTPGANVPATLQQDHLYHEAGSRKGIMARLPQGFFHLNAYPSGTFCMCDATNDYVLERNLNATLRRIKRDLLREYAGCPHDLLVAGEFYFQRRVHPKDRVETLTLYKEYVAMCMNLFSGYELGQPIPNLDVFHKLVETKLELIKLQGGNTIYS